MLEITFAVRFPIIGKQRRGLVVVEIADADRFSLLAWQSELVACRSQPLGQKRSSNVSG